MDAFFIANRKKNKGKYDGGILRTNTIKSLCRFGSEISIYTVYWASGYQHTTIFYENPIHEKIIHQEDGTLKNWMLEDLNIRISIFKDEQRNKNRMRK